MAASDDARRSGQPAVRLAHVPGGERVAANIQTHGPLLDAAGVAYRAAGRARTRICGTADRAAHAAGYGRKHTPARNRAGCIVFDAPRRSVVARDRRGG